MKKLFFALFMTVFIAGCNSGKYESVEAENGVVKIPASDVNDGSAHYYEMRNGDSYIKFFVLKSADGIFRVAFDACDVCYPEKKGYRQEGDFMICNNCGQKFHSTKINVLKGGCNPAPVDRKFDDNYVYLDVNDLKQGAFYF